MKANPLDFLRLIGLNLWVKKQNFVEYVNVVVRYYRHPLFRKLDSALLFSYLFSNPYRISKKFLLGKGEENIYAYGETPLTTMEYIAQRCGISKDDTVFELGSGRGRACFWLNCFVSS